MEGSLQLYDMAFWGWLWFGSANACDGNLGRAVSAQRQSQSFFLLAWAGLGWGWVMDEERHHAPESVPQRYSALLLWCRRYWFPPRFPPVRRSPPTVSDSLQNPGILQQALSLPPQ